jgi:hypothetical protein
MHLRIMAKGRQTDSFVLMIGGAGPACQHSVWPQPMANLTGRELPTDLLGRRRTAISIAMPVLLTGRFR